MKQRSAVSRSFLRCQPLHSHRRENEILSGKGPAKIFRPRPPRRGGVSPSSRALASSPSASVGRFSPRPLSVSSRSRSEPRGRRTDGLLVIAEQQFVTFALRVRADTEGSLSRSSSSPSYAPLEDPQVERVGHPSLGQSEVWRSRPSKPHRLRHSRDLEGRLTSS